MYTKLKHFKLNFNQTIYLITIRVARNTIHAYKKKQDILIIY